MTTSKDSAVAEETKNKTAETDKAEKIDKEIKKSSDTPESIKSDKDEAKDILEVKKDELGLEELPEDIKKRLEKKQTDNKQKSKSKKGKAVKKKKKEKKIVTQGHAYIKSTYNNTIVTLTDVNGNVLSWASAGIAGFKGPKKATPYAAQIITRLAVGKARQEYGLTEVSVFVRGVGTGRESAVRALNNNGLIITSIKDVTPIPHNGCRVRRPRRM